MVLIISISAPNMINYMVPFLLTNYIDYKCEPNGNPPEDYCTQENICKDSEYIKSYTIEDSSILDWVQ